MNIKEFNEKKKEALNINVVAEYGYVDSEALALLINKINELHPPTPPTCLTCEKYKQKENGGLLLHTHCAIVAIDDNHARQFCCIHHSDYEVKNENN